MADVQHNGNHIPFHCTDAEAHKHLTNHFNEYVTSSGKPGMEGQHGHMWNKDVLLKYT